MNKYLPLCLLIRCLSECVYLQMNLSVDAHISCEHIATHIPSHIHMDGNVRSHSIHTRTRRFLLLTLTYRRSFLVDPYLSNTFVCNNNTGNHHGDKRFVTYTYVENQLIRTMKRELIREQWLCASQLKHMNRSNSVHIHTHFSNP
jgi:hypothetical protein